MVEVDSILAWLQEHTVQYGAVQYEYTGKGMELITFKNAEDATLFKLKFGL